MLVGYSNLEQINETANSIIYQGIREEDDLAVIIKLIKAKYPTPETFHRYRQEYEIINSLEHPDIIKSYDLVRYNNQLAIILENFAAESLSKLATETKFTLEEILNLSLKIIDALTIVHQANIIHKDINPSNILFNQQTGVVKLIDFGIATQLPKEQKSIQNYHTLEGTLAYISPEQTGRMNRSLDYRSDYYSLGVTLYQLLTQQLPFNTQEPRSLIHCHLAKIPASPEEILPEIPSVVSDIVMKLMSKNAEDRYQSAAGIKHDLEICLNQLQNNGEIREFELGQKEICDRFIIPDKLYGREAEVRVLLDSFDRVAQGNAELMLVAGFSGIGKTALINEVHKPITKEKGYFIKGKFDQFNRSIPFSAFVQAFSSLIKQLLAESDEELSQWKQLILASLGNNAQVIIDVIRELGIILGEQPAVAELSGSAAQNRFNLVFSKFIQVFTTKEHPLVIFLDDLQWADSASLNLLKLLISESSNSSLLVIGAYRDNEVFPAHPLMLTLQEIEQQQASINSITLNLLTEKDINTLVADTLLCSEAIATPLSELIYQKTQGNPFFTTQFLKGLDEDGYINFNQSENNWQCDFTPLRQLTLKDDVVEFMVGRLQKLPTSTQEVLKLAACIGNQFDLATLGIICEKSEVEVTDDLWSALQAGLIIPETDIYRLFAEDESQNRSQDSAIKYRFLHDRVQQAAYALISDLDRPATHHHIGQLLQREFTNNSEQQSIFAIVGHFNSALTLLKDRMEHLELAQLNLLAAKKALVSTAYEATIQYCQIGIELLDTDYWQTDFSLIFDLYKTLASAQLSNANYKELYTTVNTVLSHITSSVERAEFFVLQITSYSLQGKFPEAISWGLNGLKDLGVEFDSTEVSNLVTQQSAEIEAILKGQKISGLIDLPEINAPAIRAKIKLAIAFEPSVYIMGNIELYSLVSLFAVRCSVEHGNIAESVKAYTNYGLLLGLIYGKYQRGYEFAGMAAQLAIKLNNNNQKCKSMLLLGGWIHVWAKPIKGAAQINYEGFLAGMEVGETEFATYNLFSYIYNLFFQGSELTSLARDIQKYYTVADRCQAELLKVALAGAQIFVRSLLKPSNPTVHNRANDLVDPAHEIIHAGEASNNLMGIGLFYALKIHQACVMGKFSEGLKFSRKLESILDALAGFTTYSYYFFYYSLIIINTLEEHNSLEEDTPWKDCIEANQKQLKTWADSCPENFLHKYLLVEAERYRCLEERYLAMDFYDRAIAGAKENEFIQEEALANELAAKFYLDWGKEKVAAGYMQEAYYCYAQWGAKAKTDHLEQHYPELLRPILQQQHQAYNPLQTLSTLSTLGKSSSISSQTNFSLNDSFDLIDILKSSQALTETLELDQLLKQLSKIILQNSGGDRLIIALADNINTWEIKVCANLEKIEVLNEPLEIALNNPIKLINYVKNTQKMVLVDNLETNLPIIDDYLLAQKPQSILALPIKYQEKLTGILYLHSSTAKSLFSPEKTIILEFLCSQAAIAINNARLFGDANLKSKIIESSVDGMAILENGLFSYLNERHVSLFGYKLDELIGQSWTKLYSKQELEYIQQEVFPILGKKGTWTGEATAIRKDGTTFPEEISLFLLDDGKLICICRDISDRQAAAESLIHSENKFRTLVSNIHGVVYRCQHDADWTMDYMSPAIQDLSGYSAAEFIRNIRTYASIIHSEDTDYVDQEVSAALAKQESFVLEYRVVHYNGSILWVLERGKGIYDSGGELLYLEGVVFDISDRKNLEQEQKKLTTILESTSDYIGISDSKGKAIWANRKLKKLRNLENTEEKTVNFFHPEWVNQMLIEEVFSTAIKEGTWSGESALLDGEGQEIPISQVLVSHKNPEGEVEYFSTIMRDISQQKIAEEQLKVSEQRYAYLTAAAPVGIFRTDVNGNCVYVNERSCQIIGLAPEVALGQGWNNRLYEDDRDRVVSEWAQSVEEERPFKLEYRFQRPDGSISWVFGQSVAEKNADGEIIGFVGTVTDISDRKAAEVALKLSEARAKAAFEQAAVGIVESDMQGGRLTKVNEHFCQMSGYTRSELLNLTIKDLTYPDDLAESKTYIQQLYSGEIDNVTLEKRYIRQDGSVFWSATTVSLIDIPGEKAKRCLAIIKDISEQKAAEQKLKFTQFVIDNSVDQVLIMKMDSQIVEANPSSCQSLGYSHTELCSLTLPDICPEAKEIWDRFSQATKQNRSMVAESTHQKKSGELFPIEVSANYLDYEGEEYLVGICRDITERKATQKSLSLNKFAIDNTAMTIFWINQEGRFVDVNQSACINLDYGHDEIIELYVWDITYGYPPEAWQPHWQELKQHNYQRFEAEHITKEGRIFPVEITATYLEYEGEGFIFAQAQDISDRKAAEQELYQSKQLLQLVLDTIPQFVFWKDSNLVYLGCNQEFAKVAALNSPNKIVGKTDYDLPWKPEEADFFVECDRRIMSSGQAELGIIESQLTAFGKKTWVETNKSPLLDKNGNVIGILGTVQDITTQKEAEQTLKRINEELEVRVLQRTADLEKTNFALTQAKRKVEKANEYEQALNRITRDIRKSVEMEQIFQVTTEELRQILHCERITVFQFDSDWGGNFIYESMEKGLSPLVDCFPQTTWNDSFLMNQEQEPCLFNTTYEVSDIYETEHSLCHIEALERFKIRAYLIVPIFVGEHLWGLLAVYNHSQPRQWQSGEVRMLQQITSHLGVALKQLELLQEMTQAREKADNASQAKSDFLSSMSHELRTPLNGILGYAQILQRDRSLTEKQLKGLKIIDQSGNHLLNLINDILDLSKIEARKLELCPSEFNLSVFLESVIGIIRMQAFAKDILFAYEVAHNLPQGIKTDEKRLRQVLINLLGNAVKFTDQGQVTLKVSQIELIENQTSTLRFEVIDTGVGMNPEQLATIFQPFEQVGDKQKQSMGTGLGLAISNQLVQLMGGEMQVNSQLGKGSNFWFEITFEIAEVDIAIKTDVISRVINYQGDRRKLLIVDDKAANRFVMQSMLEPLGFKITMAENGQQAVDLAQTIPLDLIITDLMMPVKNGFEAVKEIRQMPNHQDIPIIAVSASVLEVDVIQSKIAGCNAFLSKPIEEDKLLSLLQEYLDLTWIYEEIEESTTESQIATVASVLPTLIIPPAAEMEALYELAMLGNMKKIKEQAIYLQELDAKYSPLATKLQNLANGFQEKAIVDLIEQCLRVSVPDETNHQH